MIFQAPREIYCFHGKIQVTQDLKLLLFFGGEFLVTRETNPLKHSVQTRHGIKAQEGRSSPLLFGSMSSHDSLAGGTSLLPWWGSGPLDTTQNPHLDLLLGIKQ